MRVRVDYTYEIDGDDLLAFARQHRIDPPHSLVVVVGRLA